jgi:hypothetical protein
MVAVAMMMMIQSPKKIYLTTQPTMMMNRKINLLLATFNPNLRRNILLAKL